MFDQRVEEEVRAALPDLRVGRLDRDSSGLLLLSDVDAVYRRWGTPRQEPILRLTVEEAREGLAAGAWPSGCV